MTALPTAVTAASPRPVPVDGWRVVEADHDPRLPSRDAVAADPLLAPIRAARILDLVEPHVVEFVWPCWRRDAHKPHDGKIPTPTFADPSATVPGGERCPGVKAHPGTMIGRAT